MQQPQPIIVADLFPEILDALLDLLAGLSDDEWAAPTVCPGWSVKDLAGHLLGDDVGMLSRRRDGYRRGNAAFASWNDLVAFINRQNAEWVETARRISPRLLCDMLRLTGEQVSTFFQSLDPYALGGPVDWAGPRPRRSGSTWRASIPSAGTTSSRFAMRSASRGCASHATLRRRSTRSCAPCHTRIAMSMRLSKRWWR